MAENFWRNFPVSISRTGRHENRTKTEGSVRTLPVLPEAEEVFKYMEKIGLGKGYIFSPDGEQQIDPSAASAKLKRWLKEAGIKKDIHWHGLRGSAGSYMLENGMSIDDVSALMWHSNIGVTQKFYLWMTEKKKRAALSMMSGLFTKKEEKEKKDETAKTEQD